MIKSKIIFIILFLILLSSCSFETKKDKEILELESNIEKKQIEIDKLKRKEEIMAKIEKYRAIKSKIVEKKLKEDIEKLKSEKTIQNIDNQHLKIEIAKEKILNINFYSQFPLDIAT
jgi:predicted Holliday junction resolvase-like endonuclease